ncbi:PepSY domain-containing protein [Metapseudomonas boanensis]|uniref:PepSY domain-containing protein n=1 Tax=Metapseudomonas boanensis TaxID=2822138 RepID=A0ABS5XP63_9GAMM|nr:PepSY domain-containing protein [Pseudomonas boanensis]MBT8769073.1 PepSY domain-containing protein [Pseudomonas boanensis]
MLRQIHSLPGLVAALLVMVLALTGVVLSVEPVVGRLQASPQTEQSLSIAELAARVDQFYPGVEQLERTPSGVVIVSYRQDGQTRVVRIDPQSGKVTGDAEPSTLMQGAKDLHRSLLAGTPGRVIVGLMAGVMLVLSISGMFLLAKRVGGWRYLARPMHGPWTQRWHAEAGRLAIPGLLLSSLTGLYLSAVTFGLLPDGMQNEPEFPTQVTGGPAAPVASLPALQAVQLSDLRELVYPDPEDPTDVYSLHTANGDGYIDQATGQLLSFREHDRVRRLYDVVYQLHTGAGLWWLGLLLGASALGVPVMSITGGLIWWKRRRAMPRIASNSASQTADTLILVGSESNTTWGFAKTLHEALVQAGWCVHIAPMNSLANEYRRAERLLILTSTYGDGAAPACAKHFLEKLASSRLNPHQAFAVLGFGDRSFPRFCQFAKDVDEALLARGLRPLLAMDTVDRQSIQEFARWGKALGDKLGHELTLVHAPDRHPTDSLQLMQREAYGEQVQAPTCILRFKPAAASKLPEFDAGDLVGILPPGSSVPRFYSLASSTADGVLEICVRKQQAGLCSNYLHDLPLGGTIEAFIQPNPDFRPAPGRPATILIGAGTGIGPLAGFIRNNTARRPMHLYWGGRNPDSDFLYESELGRYLADQRLTRLQAAFSRVSERRYVQDRIIEDANDMRRLIDRGAQVLVCGSRDMAKNVMQALDEVLAPLNLNVLKLKAEGRYREDVY